MSFLGPAATAAPTNEVDDVDVAGFVVAIPQASDLLVDPFSPNNALGMNTPTTGGPWETVLGSIKILDGGAISADGNNAAVKYNVGTGDGVEAIGTIKAVPTGANVLEVLMSMSEDATTSYIMVATATVWNICKDSTFSVLDSYVAVPQAADTFAFKVIEGGDIELWVNGALVASSADTDNRANTYAAILVGGVASIGVDPTEDNFVIREIL